MCKTLGWSVFKSQFDSVKDALPLLYTKGAMIFTSLHIAEEFDEDYSKQLYRMCCELKDMGYRIIADVSPRTLHVFNETDIVALVKKLGISIVRADYGFSLQELAELLKKVPLCVNASTLKTEDIIALKKNGGELYAMHNYYPRPETGLDKKTFKRINTRLRKHNINVFSFIPGDNLLRGPLYEGLPTLEKHRKISPYAAYIDTVKKYTVSHVFVGDGIISRKEYEYIRKFVTEDIYTVPVVLKKEYTYLHDKIFTIRPDSPRALLRFQESREYATRGKTVPVEGTGKRPKGTLTVDNEKYMRYSGEIQITRKNLPHDNRVNSIGYIPEKYLLLLKHIKGGDTIQIHNE